ncbi:MAG: metallophosphoesterase [Bacteroidetes bacterium]|nr:metallophosphoesterase [Bacteroidota bacterium]
MKLEVGYRNSFEVRQEVYHCRVPREISILYLSDLHLNAFSGGLILGLQKKIHELDPSIILLGGDYVDTEKGVEHFDSLLNSMSGKNVFAIAGNHDRIFGISRLEKIIKSKKVVWLEGESVALNVNACKIQISNRVAHPHQTKADVNILCLHEPLNMDKLDNSFNLVFAGHLHGCQFVFWKNLKGLYPGRFFYKMNFLRRRVNRCLYLISKGLGDTLPLRYNCKKDVIYVRIRQF